MNEDEKTISFLTVTAIIALTTGCDPERDAWQWWTKNSTGQTLKLTFFSYQSSIPAYVTGIISPGDSILLYKIGRESLPFNHYFEKSASSYGKDVYWQLLSEDDVVLKTWNYSDMNLPNQRFFEESSWSYIKRLGHGDLVLFEHSWTFDIQQEDIHSTEQ